MDIDREIFLNQIVQGYVDLSTALNWYDNLHSTVKREILSWFSVMIAQAGVRKEDASHAIELSGLKQTYTPCVLIKKNNMNVQLSKIINLPENEYNKSFLLFIYLLRISDKRRRIEKCKGNCNHWWHKDLNDKNIVEEIKRRRNQGRL